jgi:hypothetical protein
VTAPGYKPNQTHPVHTGGFPRQTEPLVNQDGTPTRSWRTALLSMWQGVSSANSASVPSGTLHLYAGSAVPSGWFLANGQAVSRTDNQALFGAIGTTYGTGDGHSTFNLPTTKVANPMPGQLTYWIIKA